MKVLRSGLAFPVLLLTIFSAALILAMGVGCDASDGSDQKVVIILPEGEDAGNDVGRDADRDREEIPPLTGPRKPVLLVGLDGFKPSYLKRTATPNFDIFIDEGVLAEALIPVFPTKTMVNLYTIVTGLYPENTGIISNSMYDPELGEFKMFGDALTEARWFGGEPIWVTAERQGVRTGTVFWVGSEAPIKGVHPTHWLPYDSRMATQARIDQAIEWLTLEDETRPDFVTLYFSRADNVGHSHGTGHAELTSTIHYLDGAMGYLIDALKEAGLWDEINIIFASDHGMTNTDEDHLIVLDDIISLSDVYVIDWTPVAMMQPRSGRLDVVYESLKENEANYRVYKKEDIPEHYRIKNHPRVPDIMMIADLPYTITSRSFLAQNGVAAGSHGYDPSEPDMHAFFLARGPNFKRGIKTGPLEIVDLYELMAHLLQVTPAENDGSLQSISEVLMR